MEDIGGPSFSLHTAKVGTSSNIKSKRNKRFSSSFSDSIIWQTWKKNKGKRLVRSIAKKNRAADRRVHLERTSKIICDPFNRRDNATVPLYVVNEDSDEESERARKKTEKEEREEKNRFVDFGHIEIVS